MMGHVLDFCMALLPSLENFSTIFQQYVKTTTALQLQQITLTQIDELQDKF